ncbi:ATPase-IIA1 Ca [Carpediemonas membranifera]|uniref:ATPase-IIA1 Ca n=1 Tax=Carpediemonas membranifera TaxID=201153 RepID=A0A8J6B7X7_9EUKA|nr:ATPase-IIA1 Ca [Carpediemonas membranifera]|eukprot:KAG9397473.1 ATPase-IIA1 Ca [Carpediemonas membranifera]
MNRASSNLDLADITLAVDVPSHGKFLLETGSETNTGGPFEETIAMRMNEGLTDAAAKKSLVAALKDAARAHRNRVLLRLPLCLIPTPWLLLVLSATFLSFASDTPTNTSVVLLLLWLASSTHVVYRRVAPVVQIRRHVRAVMRQVDTSADPAPAASNEHVQVHRSGRWRRVSPATIVEGDLVEVIEGTVAPADIDFGSFSVRSGSFIWSPDSRPNAWPEGGYRPVSMPKTLMGVCQQTPASRILSSILDRSTVRLQGPLPAPILASYTFLVVAAVVVYSIVYALTGNCSPLGVVGFLCVAVAPLWAPVGLPLLGMLAEMRLLLSYLKMSAGEVPLWKLVVINMGICKPAYSNTQHRLNYLHHVCSPCRVLGNLRRLVLLHEKPYISSAIVPTKVHVPKGDSFSSLAVNEAAEAIADETPAGLSARAVGLGCAIFKPVHTPRYETFLAMLPDFAADLGFDPGVTADYIPLGAVIADPPAATEGWRCRLAAPLLRVSVFREQLHGKLVVIAVGTPNAVLEACTSVWTADGVQPLTQTLRENAVDIYHSTSFAGAAPCLAVATTVVPATDIPAVQTLPPVTRYDPTRHRHLVRCVSELTLLGLVGGAAVADSSISSSLESLSDVGVRVVWASAHNSRRSRALARAVGLWSEWNSCLSLKAGGEGEPLPVSDLNARLPRGLPAIRQHLVDGIDDTPLQVNVYSNSCPEDIGGLIDLFHDYGDTLITAHSLDCPTTALCVAKGDLSVCLPPSRSLSDAIVSSAAVLSVPTTVSISDLSVQARSLLAGLDYATKYVLATIAQTLLVILIASFFASTPPFSAIATSAAAQCIIAPSILFSTSRSSVVRAIPVPTSGAEKRVHLSSWAIACVCIVGIPAVVSAFVFLASNNAYTLVATSLLWNATAAIGFRNRSGGFDGWGKMLLFGFVLFALYLGLAASIVGGFILLGASWVRIVVSAVAFLCNIGAHLLAVTVWRVGIQQAAKRAWLRESMAMLEFETRLGKWSPN